MECRDSPQSCIAAAAGDPGSLWLADFGAGPQLVPFFSPVCMQTSIQEMPAAAAAVP